MPIASIFVNISLGINTDNNLIYFMILKVIGLMRVEYIVYYIILQEGQ